MQGAWELTVAFWQGLPLLQMVGVVVAGSVAGLAVGLAGVYALQRCGCLRRRNRWHHWALKGYFLLVPALAVLIGAQLGMTAAAHRAINAQIDHFRPQVHALAGAWMRDFQRALDADGFAAFGNDDTTLLETADTAVARYLSAYPMRDDPWWNESRLRRLVYGQLLRLRARLVTSLVADQLVAAAADRTGLHEAVFRHALETRLGELLDSDRILGLLKQQIGQMMRPVYLGMALEGLLLIAAIALEWGLSRQFGWSGLPPPLGRTVVAD